MPFSVKAQEIHDCIVGDNHWVRVAKRYIRHKRQYQPGPPYTLDIAGLRERLKAELPGVVPDAGDHDWDEIAKWLFELAIPGLVRGQPS
jgi:hypothetical protein